MLNNVPCVQNTQNTTVIPVKKISASNARQSMLLIWIPSTTKWRFTEKNLITFQKEKNASIIEIVSIKDIANLVKSLFVILILIINIKEIPFMPVYFPKDKVITKWLILRHPTKQSDNNTKTGYTVCAVKRSVTIWYYWKGFHLISRLIIIISADIKMRWSWKVRGWKRSETVCYLMK